MTKAERLEFGKTVLGEFARATSGGNDDPILEMRHIAAFSPDVKARLQAIRMLGLELESDKVVALPMAKWGVVRVPPKEAAKAE